MGRVAKERTITIRGEAWRLRWSTLKGDANGWCFPNTKLLLIHDQLPPAKALEILLHEFLHAAIPDFSEDAVKEIAREAAVVITTEPHLCRALKRSDR